MRWTLHLSNLIFCAIADSIIKHVENAFPLVVDAVAIAISESDRYLFVVFTTGVWCSFAAVNAAYFWDLFWTLLMDASITSSVWVFFDDISNSCTSMSSYFIHMLSSHAWLSFIALKNTFSVFVSNPLYDMDLAVTTDFEDMLAFIGDNIEFAEQDKLLAVDALLDFTAISAVELTSIIAAELVVLRSCFVARFSTSILKR